MAMSSQQQEDEAMLVSVRFAELGHVDGLEARLTSLRYGPRSAGLCLKVAIISRSEREGYDVDYLFGQVEIKERHINWEGSCGNLSAAAGVFALAEGFVEPTFAPNSKDPQRIGVWQVNQSYGMVVHVPRGVAAPMLASADAKLEETALIDLAGVAGREPPVYVEFLKPHGETPLLPTGRAVDILQTMDGCPIEATLVTPGNPTVFVQAAAAGLNGSELPHHMDYSKVLPLVEHLRAQAAPLFGIELSDQPRVAFVSGPADYVTSAGEEVDACRTHLLSRISTPGRIHHAHTGTGSIALACAAQVEGSVPWRCIPEATRARLTQGELLRIGHPGGVMEVRADVQHSVDHGWHAVGAGFDRTARYLMRGDVFIPVPERAP